MFIFIFLRWWYKPEGFVHRSVPADEGAGGEEEGPEDGEAQANATPGGVHTEHGHRGDQVEEQRASADWTSTEAGEKEEMLDNEQHCSSLCYRCVETSRPPLPQRKVLLVGMRLMQYYAIYWFTLPTAGLNAGSVRCPCVKTQGSKRFRL